jgi:hypothetical protein
MAVLVHRAHSLSACWYSYGYGMHTWYNNETGPSRNMWAIVDKIRVPNITGDFVLRWRWDTEQVRLLLQDLITGRACPPRSQFACVSNV